MIATQLKQERRPLQWKGYAVVTPLLLAGFSLFYFADIWLRASEKHFWYDELVTLYVCRIQGLVPLLRALRHGVDFNPPFFHLLTKASEGIWGEGLISTRLPEIIGFWIACLCLFRFVNRRAGLLAGLIAMTLPVLTGAFYYAYEARPHALVLGCCGLALVFWQMSLEEPRRRRWLIGFAISMFAAYMLHCYALVIAAPFAAAEVFRTVRSRRMHWQMWIALVIPAIVACLSYVPLLGAYHALTVGTDFGSVFPASWSQLSKFYVFLLSPCILITVVTIVLLAINVTTGLSSKALTIWEVDVIGPEVVLAVSFLALPVFGVVLGRLVHGPFFSRYFISALVGFCILIGFGVGARNAANWVAITLSVTIACFIALQFGSLVRDRHHGVGETLNEPSTDLLLDTTPHRPLASHSLLLSVSSNSLPIAVPWLLDLPYLVHYSPELSPRIYPVGGGANDFDMRALQIFGRWSPIKYNSEHTYDDFVHEFHHFFVYGSDGAVGRLEAFVHAGGRIEALKFADGHFLAELQTAPTNGVTPR